MSCAFVVSRSNAAKVSAELQRRYRSRDFRWAPASASISTAKSGLVSPDDTPGEKWSISTSTQRTQNKLEDEPHGAVTKLHVEPYDR